MLYIYIYVCVLKGKKQKSLIFSMIPSYIYLLVCTRATAKFDSEEASFANLLIFLERVESTLLDTKEQRLFLGGEREKEKREKEEIQRERERGFIGCSLLLTCAVT